MSDWRDYEFTPKPPRFQPAPGGTIPPAVGRGPNPWSMLVLAGMQSRPMYEGTAPRNRVRTNRRANRTARQSRRKNRR